MAQTEFLLAANEDGSLSFIYDDQLLFLKDLGKVETRRASNVEPEDKGWTATMSPAGFKTVLGPFTRRQQALEAEHRFLEENVL